jgi:hypothetical protein
LKEIGDWPTHKRFRDAKAGRVAINETELRNMLNMYLRDKTVDSAERRKFVQGEVTFTDGTSGKRTAEFILKTLESSVIARRSERAKRDEDRRSNLN